MELEEIDGLVEPPALNWLKDRASKVPRSLSIVELGTYSGQSACWIATGAREGNGAHVTCVDVWDGPGWPGSVLPSEAFETFKDRVAMFELEDMITPLRTTTVGVALAWVSPVGMMFIDADHEYDGVYQDCAHWLPHLVPGAWLAMHDYNLPGVRNVVKDILIPSGAFERTKVVEGTNMWTGRIIRKW